MDQREKPMTDRIAGRAARIETCLRDHLSPVELRVHDDSARHAHHVGIRDNGVQAGESHYNVLVISDAFSDMNRVQRSRLVHELLAAEFAGGMHALSLTLRTPAEHARMAIQ
ncbi:BolA family transcriptional regulator [Novacetimonas pomaceti]|uniref:BolA family transcriptional regulator n=2 Tax=Novacetimonas pomaceti TaxID=2021998 RepID=A0A318QEJ5_9PROT|nr:BolA family transcriptional regulator [Novacetimonas pomaceti]PYD75788.1 BolA family transcriptional regulator [Novacetimonas pomaceti]